MNIPFDNRILDFVSRETIQKFEIYLNELISWNGSTRLVQEKTLANFWERHVLDSLQLFPYIGQFTKIIDIGSGAGFPGMALAISDIQNITLCESNSKKCVFLNEVKRLTKTQVTILNDRAENIKTSDFDLITSRATCEIVQLLKYTQIVSRETSVRLLIHKGKTYLGEIENATKFFNFNWKKYDSITSKDGVILDISNINKL